MAAGDCTFISTTPVACSTAAAIKAAIEAASFTAAQMALVGGATVVHVVPIPGRDGMFYVFATADQIEAG